jgi:hypothetical protein
MLPVVLFILRLSGTGIANLMVHCKKESRQKNI